MSSLVGEIAARLTTLSVSAVSPDGNITARLQGSRPTAFSFSHGVFERYAEPDLAYQLARCMELLYSIRDREVERIMDSAGLARATRPEHARDELHRRYLRALQTLTATGTGSRALVAFDVNGIARWQCWIADGSVRSLSEHEFVTEALEAANALVNQFHIAKALLRNRNFGTRPVPPIESLLSNGRF